MTRLLQSDIYNIISKIEKNVPPSLLEEIRFLCYKKEVKLPSTKVKKVPYRCNDSKYPVNAHNSKNWSTFEEAKEALKTGKFDGIGFSWAKDESYVLVDLDNCIDPVTMQLSLYAKKIVELINSYTEISPSELGIHILCKIDKKLFDKLRIHELNIEIYGESQFCTLTGNRYLDTEPRIRYRNEQLKELIDRVNYEKKSQGDVCDDDSTQIASQKSNSLQTKVNVQSLVRGLLRSPKNTKFNKIWGGDFSDYPIIDHKTGKVIGHDQSRVDMALMGLSVRYTNKDPEMMDAIYRMFPGGQLDKWDEVHYSDGKTYGQHTIETAINNYIPFDGKEDNDYCERSYDEAGIAERIISDYLKDDYVLGLDNLIRKWVGTHWIIVDSNDLRNIVADALKKIGNKNYRTASHIDSIIRLIKSLLSTEKKEFNAIKDIKFSKLLICDNIVQEVFDDVFSWLKHNKSWYNSYCLPITFDENAKCQRFSSFLDDSFHYDPNKDETIQLFLTAITASLMNTPIHDFIVYVKSNDDVEISLIKDVVRGMVGDQNYESLDLSDLKNERKRSKIRDKLVLFIDVDGTQSSFPASTLISIANREPLSYSTGRNKSEKFTPMCTTWLLGKEFPKIKDDNHGILKKMIVIDFDNRLENVSMVPYLKQNLREELPGILNLALDAYMRQTGDFGAISNTQSGQLYLSKIQSQTNSLQMWVNACCQFDPTYKELTGELLKSYLEYCTSNNLYAEVSSKESLTKILKSKHQLSSFRENDVRGLTGIKLV